MEKALEQDVNLAVVRIATLTYGFFFFQAVDGIRDHRVTGVQTCALPICPDRAVQGSCDRRELGCLAGDNLPPLRADLERCVPLHDICAALGIRARGRRGPGSSTRDQMKTALQLLPLNKASLLLPSFPNLAHSRPPLSALGTASPPPTRKLDRTQAATLSPVGRAWVSGASRQPLCHDH